MISLLAAAFVVTTSAGWSTVPSGLDAVDFDGEYPFLSTTVAAGATPIRLLLSHGETGVTPDQIRSWVARGARAVGTYFGRFPVDELTITVLRGEDGRIGGGVTYGGHLVRIELGESTDEDDLRRDWRMTHEMTHTSFPDVDEKYHWMEEGLATYLEPIARARVGELPPEEVWGDMVDGFPNGAPGRNDRGLDKSHSWGNTYWGGCRFWLLADLEIREATGGKKSLDDALKGILAAGGNGGEHWEVERVLEVGDKATGTKVLHELHQRMGMKSAPADLDLLWKKLGVEEAGGKVRFRDDAPWSAFRRAITAPK